MKKLIYVYSLNKGTKIYLPHHSAKFSFESSTIYSSFEGAIASAYNTMIVNKAFHVDIDVTANNHTERERTHIDNLYKRCNEITRQRPEVIFFTYSHGTTKEASPVTIHHHREGGQPVQRLRIVIRKKELIKY